MTLQRTLRASIETDGRGLHTAVPSRLKLCPAPPDTGYVFIRTDLNRFEIPASVEYVASCSYATTLMHTGVMLSTVEHLLSALRGMNVDNAFIEIDNLELPIMDGSSARFVEMIEAVGTVEQATARRALEVRKSVSVEHTGERGDARRITLEPSDKYEIECTIDFPHPCIGVQQMSFTVEDEATYRTEISRARTFGFLAEIEALRRANLVRGGSLDNAVVLTPEGIANEEGVRWQDEFVRHKILDIIGDLALIGMPLRARVIAERSGHLLHTEVIAQLLRDRAAWEIVDLQSDERLSMTREIYV